MAFRMATKECSVCHYRKPANQMHKKTISQASGSSVGIYGLRRGGKAKASIRQYYRKKDIWICDECMAESSSISRFFGFGKRKRSRKTKISGEGKFMIAYMIFILLFLIVGSIFEMLSAILKFLGVLPENYQNPFF